jgi:poly(3-hydroxyalkanoate) synthetase
MAIYTQPIGNGKRYVMNWEDYMKHGFKEELSTVEDMPKQHKLDYMELMRQEMEDEQSEINK